MFIGIFNIILLIFFLLIEVAGLVGYFNLLFCYLILIRLLAKKYFVFNLILAGLFLDLFSIFPFGFYVIVFVLTGAIVNWLINRLSQISITTILFVSLVSILVYKLMIFSVGLFFYYFKISQYAVLFNQEYFRNLIYSVLANTIFIVLAFLAVKIVKNKIKK